MVVELAGAHDPQGENHRLRTPVSTSPYPVTVVPGSIPRILSFFSILFSGLLPHDAADNQGEPGQGGGMDFSPTMVEMNNRERKGAAKMRLPVTALLLLSCMAFIQRR